MTRSRVLCLATLLAGIGSNPAFAATAAADLVEGDLVITEIMKDPNKVTDYKGEWFEIYNASGVEVDLAGLYLWDGGTDAHTVVGSVIVAAGGYAVLSLNNDTTTNGGLPSVAYKYASASFRLDNTADEIWLANDSVFIDTVDYTTSFPNTPGVSLSLDPDLLDDVNNDSAASWCAASSAYGLGDLGTPGSANDSCITDEDGDGYSPDDGDCDDTDDTVYPGATDGAGLVDNDCDGLVDEDAVAADDLVVTEIQYNPNKVSDTYGEWFEVVNSSGRDLNLVGWTFMGSDGDHLTISGDLVLVAGDTLVLGAKTDTALNGGASVDYGYTRGTFKLENTSDDVLIYVGSTLVSSAKYDSTYPLVAGKALNLDPEYSGGGYGSNPTAWCVPTTTYGLGDRGTPGSANEECAIVDVGAFLEGDLVVTEIMKDPSKVSDFKGEWFELYNASGLALDLYGLVFEDSFGDSFTINTQLLVNAGDYVLLAINSDATTNGGLPSVDYKFPSSTFRFYNGADDFWIVDGATLIDMVSYDTTSYPNTPGKSLSLDAASLDTVSNDDGASWCVGATTYGSGDYGTPASANATCP